ncbi:MAG: HAD family hydrolase [Ruminococcus sp.]|nr:HAD family hydrolase [Ruminococcus sp.]
MKTLYISDLDGTLLDNTPKTSEYTNKTINALQKEGVVFSFATARSFTTAKKVIKGLTINYPAVVHNGTFIVDNEGKILIKNTFSKEDSHSILDTLLKNEVHPIVYSLIDNKEQFSYVRKTLNSETKEFLESRRDDKRNREVYDNSKLYDGEIYYFTLIGDEDKTKPLYELFKDSFQCYFQKDMYSGDYWLEILPKNATKANAVNQLKNMLSCDEIVAFGDGINDVEMFKVADKCYATENAVDELKAISTKIIESNIKNGVAKWLKNSYTSIDKQ